MTVIKALTTEFCVFILCIDNGFQTFVDQKVILRKESFVSLVYRRCTVYWTFAISLERHLKI